MAPFASGPAPRWEPGSARIQFMESGPPDGIEFAVAADFLRPPPFLRPAAFFFAAPFFAAAFFFPATLRPAFFGAAPSCRTRPSCGRSSSRQPSSVRPCVRPSSSERPSCGRPPASPAPARVAVRWLGFLRYSPVGTPSRVVGCCRAVEPRPGRRSCVGCRLPRASMPHMPGSATNQPGAHQRHRDCRICDSASDVDARSTLLHLDWSAVNGPSFR